MSQRPLQIANITEDGRYAGPQSRIATIAQRLQGNGIETTVVFPERESDRFQAELSTRNVRYLPLKLTTLGKQPLRLIRYLLRFPVELLTLVRLFRKEQYDIIHCNGSWQWKGMLAAKITGTKALWHLNDTSTPKPVMFLFRMIARYCASGFIVAGDRVRRYYLAPEYLANKPIYLIEAPVDCERFDIAAENTIQKKCSEAPLRVVTLANVNPYKDIDTLVKVASIVNETAPNINIEFLVFGGLFESQAGYISRIRKRCRHLAVDNVHFMGPTDDVPAVLQRADIYLCTSRSEASPMAVWEASASGLPIVSTDVGDIATLNKDWKFARVAKVGDAKELAQAVVYLANTSSARSSLGANAKNLASTVFDITVCSQKHANLYQASPTWP